MANIPGEIVWQANDNTWFTNNAAEVYPAGITIYHVDGRYKFTDGVTTLGALPFLGVGGTVDVNTIGTAINGATSATPNDTDLVMSVESSVAKKNTWTQIKSFLKTYFDNLFVKKGTLTTNYIQKATGTDTIGNSQITDDGTTVDIGGAPVASLRLKILAFDDTDFNGYRIYSNNAAQYSNVGWGGINSSYYLKLQSGSSQDIEFTPSSGYTKFIGNININGLTPSQIVETDASKNLVSAAKQSGYNLPLGTTAGTVLEGNRIVQTITNGDTTHAPSGDVVFDALALKLTQNNFTDITSSCTIVGWSSYTTNSIRSVDMGDYYIVTGYITGTSNSAMTSVQLPYTNNGHRQAAMLYGVNNGISIDTVRVIINGGSDTMVFNTSAGGNVWTNTGTKEIDFYLVIEK